MTVNSKHPEYLEHEADWVRCRDAYKGQRAVKHKGPAYLPKLTEQTQDEYDAYKGRALFYSITSKSVGALVGMASARQPVIKHPKEMDYYFKDNSGTQFYEVLGSILSELVLMGRYGVLVDRQTTGGRPEIYGYKTEDILNWQVNRDGKPFLVVLHENSLNSDTSDEFQQVLKQQYRILRLAPKGAVFSNEDLVRGILTDWAPLPIINEAGSDWIYTVSVYDDQMQLVKTTVPTNDGRPMNSIPFYVGNPMGVGFTIAKSPMLDIADINLSHYRTSADLEHGRHFTGLPTAVVSGVEASTKLRIGGMTAWVLPDANSRASYLEFTGQGLGSLENALKEKQGQMATLSSRLMDNSANGSEAADAIRMRYMSESASLSSIARTAEAMLNLAYTTIAAMESMSPQDVSITLEKEFHNTRISPADQVKMTESFLTGGMSIETYVFNMRRGDLIAPGRTDEEEIASIQEAVKAIEVANAKKAATPPKNQPPAQ